MKISSAVNYIDKFIDKLENTQVGLLAWVAGFAGIMAVRLFIESLSHEFPNDSGKYTTILYLHDFLFFAIIFLLIWIWLGFILKIKIEKLSFLMLWGSLLIVVSPVLDIIFNKGEIFWSFYLFNGIRELWSQYYTIFGNLPAGIVYFGAKIAIIIAVLSLSVYVYIKSRNLVKTLLNALVVYSIFFFMGSFPSWFSFVYYPIAEGKNIFSVTEIDVVRFTATPENIFSIKYTALNNAISYKLNIIYFLLLVILLVWFYAKMIENSRLFSIIKNNLNLLSVIYTQGLFIAGMAIGYSIFPSNLKLNIFSFAGFLSLAASIWLAYIAPAFIKKCTQDASQEYAKEKKHLFIATLALSLLGGLVVGFKFFILISIFQIVRWMFLFSPFRIKNIPIVSTIAGTFSSFIILMMGYVLLSKEQLLNYFPGRVVILLFIGYAIFASLDDFKNMEKYKKEKTLNPPFVFGEYWSKLIIGAGIFFFYILSVLIFNEFRASWLALMAGGASFWIVMLAGNNKKINYNNIVWWILSVFLIFGLFVVKINQ